MTFHSEPDAVAAAALGDEDAQLWLAQMMFRHWKTVENEPIKWLFQRISEYGRVPPM